MKNSVLMRLVLALAALALFATACGSDGVASTVTDAAGDVADTATDAADAAVDAVTTDDDTMEDDAPADDSMEEEVVVSQGGDSVLDQVISRGTLNCGVSGSAVAFSETQPNGDQVGFDADYCRVVAAAVLGDANAVNFVALTASERFTAVQTGDVDLLMRNTTWTQSRDSEVGMDFGPTTYYDGQQFMGRSGDGFTGTSTIDDLDGLTVCTNSGTTTEKNVSDAADAAGITVNLGGPFEDFDQVTTAFIDGTCDVITTDGSGLVGRAAVNEPNDWVIFPPAPISKEPLGPTYGQNDSRWADAVNWAVYATIIADEKGINSGNVADALTTGDAEAIRLLGGEGELQSGMGLPADGFYQAIAQVGNYSEIYEANLGPVGLKREGSANAHWQEGGLIYAPPAR